MSGATVDTGAAREIARWFTGPNAYIVHGRDVSDVIRETADALDAARAERDKAAAAALQALAGLQRELDENDRLYARAEAAEAEVARLRAALEPFARFAAAWDAKPLRGTGDAFYSIHAGTEWEAELTLTDCRNAAIAIRALAAGADTTTGARWTRERDDAHRLAMLALQSERYAHDADYRDATDAVLAAGHPPALADAGRGGGE